MAPNISNSPSFQPQIRFRPKRPSLGLGEQTAGPGHGLERRTLIVGGTTIALPAADRQHELDPRPVGHLRQSDAIRPAAG
ncbi:hypothetical protein, partial [Pseudomonas aeruginosa]|uniref:hypothetical protein n=1 Tax=Pseudomonas aeruginosa TaxID=287 RepID=UPI0021AC1EF8